MGRTESAAMRYLLCFICLLGAPALAESPYVGSYQLEIGGSSGWHKHVLALERFGDPMVGSVTLDQGLGPQARTPQPHERAFVKRFKAAYEGESFEFSVTTGAAYQTRYEFELFPLAEGRLVGTVTIYTKDYTRRAGVAAKRVGPLKPGL